MKYLVTHETSYQYSDSIGSCVMSLCMLPRTDENQRLLDSDISIVPITSLSTEVDVFGNVHHVFDIHQPHHSMTIRGEYLIEKLDRPERVEVIGDGAWEKIQSWRTTWDLWSYVQQTNRTSLSSPLKELILGEEFKIRDDPLVSLDELEKSLHESFEYRLGETHVGSTIEDLLTARAGVCQDFAHLMLAIARSWGVPARYVSGYLYIEDAENNTADNATHAWVECLLPGLGWTAFDPTNPEAKESSRLAIAIGRDYDDVSPSRGITYGQNQSQMQVSIAVNLLD